MEAIPIMSNARRAYAPSKGERRPSTNEALRTRRAERSAREAERAMPAPLDTAALEAELHAARELVR